MSYPINYPTPQSADVQIFYAPVRPVSTAWTAEWVKPQGASFVWFTLIGAGGGGGSSDGISGWRSGGTGAVTNCMVPAFLIPDVLQVRVGKGGAGAAPGGFDGSPGTATIVFYQQKAGTGYTLISANAGGGGVASGGSNGGAASAAGSFGIMGLFQSIEGESGTSTGPSATTFLGGVNANYGYSSAAVSPNGFFQMQPIIVSVMGVSNGLIVPNVQGGGGIGCGGSSVPSNVSVGSADNGGDGGDGLCVIISW